MTETMTYDRLERTDVDYKADTVGKWPGIAGIIFDADVYCPTCAKEMLGDEKYRAIVNGEDMTLGPWDLGSAVLSDEEWDCPGATCGHCGIELDVRVIHYDGVCQPEYCPEW